MSITLLATADIHIGRRPTRLPSTEDAERCSAAAMWDTIVETAIARNVDALVLAGDVVEADTQYYEAFGRLEAGLNRLAEAGIHTYAVSGNHDYEVFPRILASVGGDYLHLVGRGCTWETVTHHRAGAPVLQFHGWSFPTRYVDTSPLDNFSGAREPGLPVIGILHGDVDVSDSRYGPITTRQLESTDADLWILGHVHQAALFTGGHALYTGSPQALDPGERGAHGPWLIHIDAGREIRCEQLACSRVRYDEVALDLSGTVTEEDFQAVLERRTGEVLLEMASVDTPPERAVLRLVLEGATPLCGVLDQLAGQAITDFERTFDGITGYIEKVTNRTRPVLDLAEVATMQDPTGVLAGTMRRLEAGDEDEDLRRLLQTALEELRRAHGHPTYADLPNESEPDMEDARRVVLHQGLRLLETLRQQEETP